MTTIKQKRIKALTLGIESIEYLRRKRYAVTSKMARYGAGVFPEGDRALIKYNEYTDAAAALGEILKELKTGPAPSKPKRRIKVRPIQKA